VLRFKFETAIRLPTIQMVNRRTLLLAATATAYGNAMSNTNDSTEELTSQHKFFVAMHYGTFPTEAQAIAAARLPTGTAARGEFQGADGSKLFAFKSPPKTTDTKGLEVLILERTASGAFHLWLSATDLARPTREEAKDDEANFKEVGRRTFRVFERR
jgi:hypothetical protein